MYGRDTLHECHYPALQDTMGRIVYNWKFCLSVRLSVITSYYFYRTHVHMGSDHWVAMSLRTYKTLLTLVDDPS